MAGVAEHIRLFFEQTLQIFFGKIATTFGFVIEDGHVVGMYLVHQEKMILMPANDMPIKNATA